MEAVENEDATILRLSGEIDLTNARDVANALLQEVSDDASGLVAELSGVTYLDSAGVRLFVDVAERLQRNRQRLALCVPPGSPISRTLSIVKMELLVPVHESLDEAVAALTASDLD
jgi:anti-anti-sigma factor